MSLQSKLSFLVILIVFSACSSRTFISISKNDFRQLKSDVTHLQNNTLVVRLYTNNPKVKVLRKGKNIEGLKKHLQERREYMHTMMGAWNEKYNFSEVLYIPDSLFKTFVADRQANVFLNDQLDIDSTIMLSTEDYFVLGRGERDLAFVWYDSNLDLLNPQPPVNFDKLTPWEMINGKEKFLKFRVNDLNDYFYKVVKTPIYE